MVGYRSSEALEEPWMLSDGLLGTLKGTAIDNGWGLLPFQIVDELPHRILFPQRRDRTGEFESTTGIAG